MCHGRRTRWGRRTCKVLGQTAKYGMGFKLPSIDAHFISRCFYRSGCMLANEGRPSRTRNDTAANAARGSKATRRALCATETQPSDYVGVQAFNLMEIALDCNVLGTYHDIHTRLCIFTSTGIVDILKLCKCRHLGLATK
jgi:hypothetical protein